MDFDDQRMAREQRVYQEERHGAAEGASGRWQRNGVRILAVVAALVVGTFLVLAFSDDGNSNNGVGAPAADER